MIWHSELHVTHCGDSPLTDALMVLFPDPTVAVLEMFVRESVFLNPEPTNANDILIANMTSSLTESLIKLFEIPPFTLKSLQNFQEWMH